MGRAASGRPLTSERLSVLAICDSPLVRQLVTTIFSKESDFSITTAFDWRHAEHRLRAARPDVALLCSDRLRPDDEGARAIHTRKIPLVAGALDIRAANVQAALLSLTERVRQAPRPKRSARPSAIPLSAPPASAEPPLDIPPTPKLVAIGASAGGTMALKSILQELPPRSPPIVIVQHMSEHFTGPFAEGLGRICSIAVREAQSGDALIAGRALIAPGNRHLVLRRRGTQYFVELSGGPLVSRHRPSVNVLFRSAAQEAGPNGVGVILTGMGDDGADGLFEMRELGADTVAQDEATSAVFGMPRAAILRGGARRIVALGDMPAVILKCVAYRQR